MQRAALAVLVSGAGTNLRALATAAEQPGFPATIAMVVCNRRDAGAIDVCRELELPLQVMPLSQFGGDSEARDAAMVELLRSHQVVLVICAGYNRVLSDGFLEAFPDAILNLHPSLLPAFGGGMNAVELALEAGVRISGCTVHMLQAGETDGGPIILQAAVPVLTGDDATSLRRRINLEEWRLLPEAVELWCHRRLRRSGRRIEILEPHEVIA